MPPPCAWMFRDKKRKAAMAVNAEKQRAKIEKMVDALAKEQARLLMAEKEEKRKQARAASSERRKEKAALLRQADAHRKIVLGGLLIAAGADGWDPAELVGGLLVVGEKLAGNPALREQLRAKGIAHLEARSHRGSA